MGQNLFSTGKLPFFSKIFDFNKLLRPLKIAPMSSKVNVRIACGLLNCSLRFVTPDIMKKNGPKIFCHREIIYFFEKYISVDHIGPKETMLSFAQ